MGKLNVNVWHEPVMEADIGMDDMTRTRVTLRDEGMERYKPDWREAKERMLDWWAGKKTDRVVAAVSATRKGCKRHEPRGALMERHTDPVTIFGNFEDWLPRMLFGGGGIPDLQVESGTGDDGCVPRCRTGVPG